MKKEISVAKIGDRKFLRVGDASIEIDAFKLTSTEENESVLEVRIDLYGRGMVIETSSIEE